MIDLKNFNSFTLQVLFFYLGETGDGVVDMGIHCMGILAFTWNEY